MPEAQRRPRLNTKGGSVKRKSVAEKEGGKKADAKAMLEQAKAHAAGDGEVVYSGGDGDEDGAEDGDISALYAEADMSTKKSHNARHEAKKGARTSMEGGALIGSANALGNFEMAPPKDEKGGGCCIIA